MATYVYVFFQHKDPITTWIATSVGALYLGVMIGQMGGDIIHTQFEEAIKHHNEINPTLLEIVEILA